MRHPKGSISLSRERDYPLLRELAYCGFASHEQLFESMHKSNRESSRRSFNWRVRRLVKQQVLHKETLSGTGGEEHAYALTESSIVFLQGVESRFMLFLGKSRERNPSAVRHSLEVNDIRLCGLRQNAIDAWISATEIRSANEAGCPMYAKDYDGIAVFNLGGRKIPCAMEYERSIKTRKKYDAIAQAIGQERHLDYFLYLAANSDLMQFILWSFRNVKRHVVFGLGEDWCKRTLGMSVFSWETRSYAPLKSLLIPG